jgi:hypothetical protein|tara:strand:+ start:578 stop:1276 length:699 start_codon:yes stop_codon:yes gene_type:complete
MNKRIAVCLTGEVRYWEITKHVFKDWNVDFFISTWDTTNRKEDNYPYKFHGNSDINDNILETLSPKGYEFLSREIENKIKFHMPKYYYLVHRSNLLKTQYELDNDFKYDCVIMTRPDVYYDRNPIKQIKSQKLDELVLYSGPINRGSEYFGLGMMDAAAYGTSATMDIFSSIYKHQYLSGNHNMLPIGHSIIPHYLKYIGLDLSKRTEISQYLINKVRKPKEYKRLLKGVNV